MHDLLLEVIGVAASVYTLAYPTVSLARLALPFVLAKFGKRETVRIPREQFEHLQWCKEALDALNQLEQERQHSLAGLGTPEERNKSAGG